MVKTVSLTGLTLVLATSYALAGASQMESGRPHAVLTPEQCSQVWTKAVPEGETLAPANAAPFVANFQQADTDKDNKLSKANSKRAVAKG